VEISDICAHGHLSLVRASHNKQTAARGRIESTRVNKKKKRKEKETNAVCVRSN